MKQDQREAFEITFAVEPDLEGSAFVAFWDDPAGGGITTQANTLAELAASIKEAGLCHFFDGPAPQRAVLNFASAELRLA